ncbi:hypothetical protein TOPH_02948 [Tolypocladium ophioglossoides CBS 100239]|uniref:Aminoglycoside phosphotransferase domain-containing protein n=1 Tax=Tolypocladium ophioglossoides (strain CBS 100239) TaxID=1163406 RepID=A0A0L0NDU1_TOLOC|nr:hypothetical protein TOPH_02948 [Tolypocladium ophioglossoides CBS 100239]
MEDPPVLKTLRGQVDVDKALADDDNVLAQLRYPEQKKQFWGSLAARKAEIEAIVRAQLGIDWCHLCVMEIWKSGSFNVVMPLLVRGQKTAYFRLPLPYKAGEAEAPGNLDEKLRAEIATYIWLQEHCPDVPIPTLHGFGLSDGSSYTHPSNTPFVMRKMWEVWRWILSLLGRPVPTRYVRRRFRNPLESGYLILSQAEGDMLALSWEDHRHDKSYRERLFRGLANVAISMNRTPLPRIGSFIFNTNGCITLSNRPLDLHFQMLENEGIPSGIPRQRTYAAVESYISDLLSFQDSKILNQPNAIHNKNDGECQLAALTALRAIMHKFIRPEYREWPFFYTLSDLHQCNIFVDDQWNVQTIIDLEWAYSKPIEMQLPPYWLTSRSVDSFYDDEAIAEYETVLNEYFDIYEAEEKRRNGFLLRGPTMRHVWESGSFWYFQAVSVPKGMYNLFSRHVQPRFNKQHYTMDIFNEVFFWYWGFGAQEVINKKLEDKADYLVRLRAAYGCETEDVASSITPQEQTASAQDGQSGSATQDIAPSVTSQEQTPSAPGSAMEDVASSVTPQEQTPSAPQDGQSESPISDPKM